MVLKAVKLTLHLGTFEKREQPQPSSPMETEWSSHVPTTNKSAGG